MRTAVTRPPDAAIARCELRYLERRPIDPDRAREEHALLERRLEDLGCRLLRLPPLPDQPDAAFVEDTAVVLDGAAVCARPGAASRRGETPTVEAALAPFRPIRRIEAPGTLDGGDVLCVGRRLFVGRSVRTNDAGIEQLRVLAEPLGYATKPVDVTGCLHLKSAACALDEETLLVNPAWVDADAFGPVGVIDVDPAEPFAANVLRLGDTVLTADGFTRTRRRLEVRGYDVRATPFGELMKAEAGVTCCSIVFEDGS